MNRSDGILVLSLLALALLAFLLYTGLSKDGSVCHILHNRQVVMTVNLDEDSTFSVEGVPHIVFQVKDGRIAFIQSDCPDQICVRSGFIGTSGQSAACLPNGIAIRIQGSDGPDTVA